jgi:hypothetical protein
MSKREQPMDEAYFAERIRKLDQIVDDQTRKLKEQPEVYIKPAMFLYTNFRSRYQQIFLGYSTGEDLEQLKARMPAVVDAYEKYLNDKGATATDLADLDEYIVSLWLVSFAILFQVDDSPWQRLLACIGNEGRDALFEALVATRSPGRKKANGLLHEAIFSPLFHAISANGESRNAFIKRYLKDWYKSLKPTYWIDSHLKPKSGTFFGYWAVEVAGVVKAFDMDDEAFRDMPYYPRDLVS